MTTRFAPPCIACGLRTPCNTCRKSEALTPLQRVLQKPKKRPTPVLPREAPPVFVPAQYQAFIGRMPKALLMDIAWDFAIRCAGSENPEAALGEFLKTADIMIELRKPVSNAA